MSTSIIRDVLVELDQPTDTHTTYLITYDTGAVVADVHETIDRWLNHDRIQSIMLVLPNVEHAPVWVEISEADSGAAHYVRFHVAIGDEVIEEVIYANETREEIDLHEVYVHGFTEPPAIPDLPE